MSAIGEQICIFIKHIHLENPELRIGQILGNCLFEGEDLYYMTDYILLERLQVIRQKYLKLKEE